MNYSKSGQALTEQFEGCRLNSYPDVHGIWTIGYGHTRGVAEGMACDQEQADAWLAQDMAWAGQVVNELDKVPLTQGEYDALVDFVFNVGSGNFEHSHLLDLVNQKQFALAAKEFEKWQFAGGKKIAGLLRRRIAEEQEFNS